MTGRILPRSARLLLVYSFTPAWGPACPCVERVRASKTYVMCADPAGGYFRRFTAGVLSLSRAEGPRFAAPVASPAPLRWISRSNSVSVKKKNYIFFKKNEFFETKFFRRNPAPARAWHGFHAMHGMGQVCPNPKVTAHGACAPCLSNLLLIVSCRQVIPFPRRIISET